MKTHINFGYNFDLGFEAYPALANYFEKYPDANRTISKRLTKKIKTNMNSIDYSWDNIFLPLK